LVTTGRFEIAAYVRKGELGRVPQLVAEVPVSLHLFDIQIDGFAFA